MFNTYNLATGKDLQKFLQENTKYFIIDSGLQMYIPVYMYYNGLCYVKVGFVASLQRKIN